MTDKETLENEGIDAETLEASFAIIASEGERLVERFYEVLFERHPTVQPLFANSDMKLQRSNLLAALKLVVASLRDEDTLVPALQAMVRRYEKYGADPDHYVAIASVLLFVMANRRRAVDRASAKGMVQFTGADSRSHDWRIRRPV